MNPVVEKNAGKDGWKAVTMDDATVGHVKKVGEGWRAKLLVQGKFVEHLGFKTAKSAAMKLKTLSDAK